MKRISIILILSLCLFSCHQQSEYEDDKLISGSIENYLSDVMELHNIPGLALGVVHEGKVVYKNYFGQASLSDSIAVNEKTLFRIFSATKLITTTGVFQLVESGRLNLNDKISLYLDNLPTAWHDVKIENLLSHSSGLPDVIRHSSDLSDTALLAALAKEEMQFQTGERFNYNQTNYWFLTRIIEKITGVPFEDFVISKQFDGTSEGIRFSSNSSDKIDNRATRYNYNAGVFKEDTNDNGRRAHSGNGLNMTLDCFIQWSKKLDNGDLLGEEVKNLMWSPFAYTNSDDDFLHGWGSYKLNGMNSYGFSGGNVAAFRRFESAGTTIVLLSNGYEIPAYDIIVNDIARMVIPSLRAAKPTLEEDVISSVINNQYEQAKSRYDTLRSENINTKFDNLKWNINSLGNSFSRNEEMENALAVYGLNAEVNSDWWVSYASLAEAYDAINDVEVAITNYEKAIVLNVNNDWGFNAKMEARIVELDKLLN